MTGDDWLELAGLAQNFNMIRQRDRELAARRAEIQYREEERRRKAEYERDVQHNADVYLNGGGTSALRGTPQARRGGREIFLKNQQMDFDLQKLNTEKEYREAMRKMLTWKKDNPQGTFDDMPGNLYMGIGGHKARADLADQVARTQGNALLIAQRRRELLEKVLYPKFVNGKKYIEEQLLAGDKQKAIKATEQLSRDMRLPRRLTYNSETNKFDVEYKRSLADGYSKVGEITPEEALLALDNIAEPQFMEFYGANYEAIRQKNLHYQKNPFEGKDHHGNTYIVYPQKETLNPDNMKVLVYDKKTNEGRMFDSWADLNRAGIHVKDLKRKKQELDIKKQELDIAGKQLDNIGKGFINTGRALDNQGKIIDNDQSRLKLKQLRNPQPKPLTIKEQEAAHERNAKAFAIQAKDLGVGIDQMTGDVVGNVPVEALPKLLKMAEYYGVQIADGQGQVIDMNGWWPGGKQKFVQIQALPFGTMPYKNSKFYVKLFAKTILEEKEHIFLFIQQYYRAFMNDKPVSEYPIYQIIK